MKEANIKVQFCWAHLIRDIKFLSESSDKVTANYGDRLLLLCKQIFHLQHRRAELGEEYFLFIENPQIEPTNNLAEREVRHCVIDRRITQGTRGPAGQRWCERIGTVLATCARQDRDAFSFVSESVRTFYAGEQQPSLLPEQ